MIDQTKPAATYGLDCRVAVLSIVGITGGDGLLPAMTCFTWGEPPGLLRRPVAALMSIAR